MHVRVAESPAKLCLSVAGKRHTDVRSLVGGVTDRDRLTALTRDLVDELVDRMLGP